MKFSKLALGSVVAFFLVTGGFQIVRAMQSNTTAAAPVWFKVAIDGATLTAVQPMTVRWGAAAGTVRTYPDASATLPADAYSASFALHAGTMTVDASLPVPDPAFGYVKGMYVLETDKPQTLSVNGAAVTVPTLNSQFPNAVLVCAGPCTVAVAQVSTPLLLQTFDGTNWGVPFEFSNHPITIPAGTSLYAEESIRTATLVVGQAVSVPLAPAGASNNAITLAKGGN